MGIVAGLLDINGGAAAHHAAVALRMAGIGKAEHAWSDAAVMAMAAHHPPAASQDGRWVAVLDGAVHNRADLRRRLDPVDWQGRSDAETLVEAVARWGLERTLQTLDGTYAVALWDRLERALHLARDPMGEKTLYWSLSDGMMLFGSNLKALRAHPRFDGALDHDAVAAYLRWGHVPAPATIHRHARKLAAGSALTIQGPEPVVRLFWDAEERALALAGNFAGGAEAAAELFNALLRASVALRLESDHTVGVILDGDGPSALAAAAARALGAPELLSVSLKLGGCDPAAQLAAALETRHVAVPVDDDTLRGAVQDLPKIWTEPLADPCMLPALLVSRAASRHMDVALTGAGAEVLFGGDPLYRRLPEEWQRLKTRPKWRRRLDRALGRPATPESPAGFLADQRALWRGLPDPVSGGSIAPTRRAIAATDPTLAAMVADSTDILPDHRLLLAGRPAAAHGLELRSPFLDPAMVELALSLPAAMAPEDAPLRNVLCRYLPPDIVGLAAPPPPPPLKRWLSGPLAEWAGDLLSPERLRRRGLVDPATVERCRREDGQGKDRSGELWTVLMLEAWTTAQDVP